LFLVEQVKNYECGECGYSCYLKTDLERHILNVHDKVSTYVQTQRPHRFDS
jgi:hypothetical protein